jgi:hypothetical protein
VGDVRALTSRTLRSAPSWSRTLTSLPSSSTQHRDQGGIFDQEKASRPNGGRQVGYRPAGKLRGANPDQLS